MGIRILAGRKINEGPNSHGAVLYQSTAGLAYPFIFEDEEDAQAFLDHYGETEFARLCEAGQAKLFDAWIGVCRTPLRRSPLSAVT